MTQLPPEVIDVLQECQELLTSLTNPDDKSSGLGVATMWVNCRRAEARVRAVLAVYAKCKWCEKGDCDCAEVEKLS